MIFKIFGFFLVILVPLKSYYIILILLAPIGLVKTFNGSLKKFSEKKAYGLNSFDTFFSQFSTELLDFACFC